MADLLKWLIQQIPNGAIIVFSLLIVAVLALTFFIVIVSISIISALRQGRSISLLKLFEISRSEGLFASGAREAEPMAKQKYIRQYLGLELKIRLSEARDDAKDKLNRGQVEIRKTALLLSAFAGELHQIIRNKDNDQYIRKVVIETLQLSRLGGTQNQIDLDNLAKIVSDPSDRVVVRQQAIWTLFEFHANTGIEKLDLVKLLCAAIRETRVVGDSAQRLDSSNFIATCSTVLEKIGNKSAVATLETVGAEEGLTEGAKRTVRNAIRFLKRPGVEV